MAEDPKKPEVPSAQVTTSDDSSRPRATGIASFTQGVSLSSIGQFLTIVTLSGYVLGLLVVNMYLFKIGVSDFSVLRPRFVLTGFLATIPLLFVANIALAVVIAVEGFSGRPRPVDSAESRFKSVLVWFAVFMLFAITTLTIWGWVIRSSIEFRSDLNAEFDGSDVVSLFYILLLIPTIIALISTDALLNSASRRINRTQLQTWGFPIGLIFMFSLLIFYYIDFFSSTFYPIVPEQFGGGGPKEVAIILAPDSNALGATLGFREAAQGLMSRHVDLLWETEQVYVVRDRTIRDAPVVLIDRDAVSAVVFAPDAVLGATPIASPLPAS